MDFQGAVYSQQIEGDRIGLFSKHSFPREYRRLASKIRTQAIDFQRRSRGRSKHD
jgi:hypothetical protein